MKKLLYSLGKFGVAGSIGLVVDFCTTLFLKEFLRIDPYLANACGFSLAVINNFYINKYWTFKSRSGVSSYQFVSFLCVSLLGLFLNTLLLVLFNKYLGLNFYISKLIAIFIVFVWNFIANKKFTFR